MVLLAQDQNIDVFTAPKQGAAHLRKQNSVPVQKQAIAIVQNQGVASVQKQAGVCCQRTRHSFRTNKGRCSRSDNKTFCFSFKHKTWPVPACSAFRGSALMHK